MRGPGPLPASPCRDFTRTGADAMAGLGSQVVEAGAGEWTPTTPLPGEGPCGCQLSLWKLAKLSPARDVPQVLPKLQSILQHQQYSTVFWQPSHQLSHVAELGGAC